MTGTAGRAEKSGGGMAESIGEIIKKARKEKGMTQAKLAQKLSVTPQAVSKWEQGRNLPDVTLLQKIAEILSVEPALLYSVAPNESGTFRKNEKKLKKTVKATKILAAALLAVACVFTGFFIFHLVNGKRDAARYHASMALGIAAREDNYYITFRRNGKEGVYCRKYFFDGRLLYYCSFDGNEYYGYGEKTYRKTGDSSAEETEGLSLFPVSDLDGLVVPSAKMKKAKEKGDFVSFSFRPQGNDIYAYLLGKTPDRYDVELTETDGELKTLKLTSGEDICLATFRYAYDFSMPFPSFVPQS